MSSRKWFADRILNRNFEKANLDVYQMCVGAFFVESLEIAEEEAALGIFENW